MRCADAGQLVLAAPDAAHGQQKQAFDAVHGVLRATRHAGADRWIDHGGGGPGAIEPLKCCPRCLADKGHAGLAFGDACIDPLVERGDGRGEELGMRQGAEIMAQHGIMRRDVPAQHGHRIKMKYRASAPLSRHQPRIPGSEAIFFGP